VVLMLIRVGVRMMGVLNLRHVTVGLARRSAAPCRRSKNSLLKVIDTRLWAANGHLTSSLGQEPKVIDTRPWAANVHLTSSLGQEPTVIDTRPWAANGHLPSSLGREPTVIDTRPWAANVHLT